MKRNRLFAFLFLIAGVALNLSAQSVNPDDHQLPDALMYLLSDNNPVHAKLSDIDGQPNAGFYPRKGLDFSLCETMKVSMRFSDMTLQGVGEYYPYWTINISLVSQDLDWFEPRNICTETVSMDSLSSFSHNDSIFLSPGVYKLRLSVEKAIRVSDSMSISYPVLPEDGMEAFPPVKASPAVALSSDELTLMVHQHTLSVDLCAHKHLFPQEEYPGIPHPDFQPLHTLNSFPGKNTVSIFKSRDGSESDGSLSISYYDDIGRMEQTVRQKFTPQMKDLVTWQEYDSWGRKSNTWLPVPVMQDSGMHVLSDVYKKQALKTYEGDTRTYTSHKYEASPLEKVVGQCGPGRVWHEHGHTVKTAEFTNVTGNDILDCYSFRFVEGAGDALSILAGGDYPDGSLFVTRTEDEGGKLTFEFKDKSGRVVLLRQADSATDSKQVLDTYYVYDDLGQLRVVLPPALSGHLSVGAVEPRLLGQYAYLYKYDAAGNLSAKKLPGIDWTYYVYDRNSRMILSQTGVERAKGECEFYISDSFGRVCLQGVCRNKVNPFEGKYLDSRITCKFSGIPECAGYTLFHSGPAQLILNNPEIRTVNYYDNYNFMNDGTFGPDSLFACAARTGFREKHTNPRGFLTGTLSLHLSSSGASGTPGTSGTPGKTSSGEVTSPTWRKSVIYYDEHGQKIQTVSDHHLNGSDRDFYNYNPFTGNLISHLHEHTRSAAPVLSELYTYTYDSSERLTGVSHKLNNKPEVLLSGNEYNELGQLCTQSLHNGLLHTAYEHNVRGWLSQIENPLFHQNLHYTDGAGVPCYDGNISSMTWSADSSDLRGYRFFYDGFSRLTDAVYAEGCPLNENPNRFSEHVTSYDKMGNILALKRYGQTSADGYGLIDDLNLSYNGNQLKAVNDNAINPVYADGFEFKDGAKQDVEYFYDANGNLIKDLNKKIADIEYNYLNLPDRIEFEDGSSISYLYDAAGSKLRVVHCIAGNTTTTDYCGNVIYENGIPKTLLTDAGFVSLSDSRYHYYLQDHQGNNRVVVSQNGTVEEVNQYYPFGGTFASTSSVQPYKYNGKELDRKGGLDWYDYGARHYDAALGRWHAVDPMAEKYYGVSPYNYCLNNPFKLIDPNGMWPDDPLLQPFGRYHYGDNMAVNSFKFIHNTVAAVVNTPINIINQLADETGYIYNNGVGSYLSSGTKNIGDAVSAELSYRVNTTISQQAADTWQAMKDPQNWENATATAALMLSPMKGSGTVGATQTVSAVTNGGTKTVYRVFGGDSRAQGFSWTPINPQKVSNYRNKAGLPSGGESGFNNTADFMIKGEVKTQNVIKKRAALPLDGNKGGLPEYIINPEHVNITNFTVLKP